MTQSTSYRTQPELPVPFAQLLSTDVDYCDEEMDFEPYSDFMSTADTASWFRAWTGNDTVDASSYLVFGQDGTGGYAAIWLATPGAPLLDQPIVFFGSEGELGVVAATTWDFMWLLAGGVGPYEAASGWLDARVCEPFVELALAYAPGTRKSPSEIVLRANALYPDFVSSIRDLSA